LPGIVIIDEATEIGMVFEELLQCVYDDKLVLKIAKLLTKRLTPEERAAVVSRTVEDGRCLLFVAVDQRRTLFVDFLLEECHADTQQRDDHDMTPLAMAASAGEPNTVMSLIRHGVNVNAVAYGMPILQCSIRRHEIDESIVRMLVENGADVNPPADNG